VELERTYTNYSAWFNFGGQETAWDGAMNASPSTSTLSTMAAVVTSPWAVVLTPPRLRMNPLEFNLVWDVTDSLSLWADYHDSTAEQVPDSPFGSSALLSIAAFSRDKTTTYFDRGDLPCWSLDLSNPLDPPTT
jgi:hypothetical protein